jgi:hypothetical protein
MPVIGIHIKMKANIQSIPSGYQIVIDSYGSIVVDSVGRIIIAKI